MDVLVSLAELEHALIELALNAAQPPLDGGESSVRQDSRGREPPGVGDAAGDVIRIQLEVGLERGRETLELRQQAPAKARTPQLGGLGGLAP